MELTDFKPRSRLVAKVTPVDKPMFPVIDAHNHLGEAFGGGWDKRPLNELLDVLESLRATAGPLKVNSAYRCPSASNQGAQTEAGITCARHRD